MSDVTYNNGQGNTIKFKNFKFQYFYSAQYVAEIYIILNAMPEANQIFLFIGFFQNTEIVIYMINR